MDISFLCQSFGDAIKVNVRSGSSTDLHYCYVSSTLYDLDTNVYYSEFKYDGSLENSYAERNETGWTIYRSPSILTYYIYVRALEMQLRHLVERAQVIYMTITITLFYQLHNTIIQKMYGVQIIIGVHFHIFHI